MEKYEIENLVNSNNTAYNLRDLISWDSFSLDELDSLIIVREFQNLNNEFRNSITPIKFLQEEGDKIHINRFLNLRKNIYKRGFHKDKAFWLLAFNFEIFKGRGTDLFFIKIKFKNRRGFLWFFAIMGLIKSNWTYKGEFTAKERRLLYKLKNPIKREFGDFDDLLLEISIKKDKIKKIDILLTGLIFNKWVNWYEIQEITKEVIKEKEELKRLLSIKESWEDNLLNTNRLWE